MTFVLDVTITVTGGVSTGPPDPPGQLWQIRILVLLSIVCYAIDPVNNATDYE
ncbi:MAG: hypothetical protein R2784_04815 [Saprospiraceae bacterium]